MKRKNWILSSSAIACVSLALSFAAPAAQVGVSVTETIGGCGPGCDTLAASIGTVIPSGPESWILDFTGTGITIGSTDLPVTWVEFAGELGFNIASIIDINHLLLQSEFPVANPGGQNFCGTGQPLQLGVACFIGTGNGNTYFLAWNEVEAVQAPEPSIIALFGLGLAGFAFSRRKKS